MMQSDNQAEKLSPQMDQDSRSGQVCVKQNKKARARKTDGSLLGLLGESLRQLFGRQSGSSSRSIHIL